jgi:S1-C subfamily serine protease
MDVDTTDLNSTTNPLGTPLLGANGEIEAVVTGSSNGKAVVTPGWLAGPVSAELVAHDTIEHGWIGVEGVSISNATGHELGVLVEGVQSSSAAAKAGLRAGEVIVALDGQRLTSMSQLQGRLYVLGAGTKVRLSVDQKGARKNVAVTLSVHPPAAVAAAN